MPSYKAPVDDVIFLLTDVLDIDRHRELPGFEDVSRQTLRAILEEGGRICAEKLLPLNASGDREGCRRAEDGSVATPKGFKAAYEAYREGGWIGLPVPAEYGGMGLPATLNAVMQEFVTSANFAFGMYPGLTQGAMAALLVHGSQEQKATYIPKMAAGEWSGTMNLTEPHCGTDLGLLRTRAAPQPDGSYAITGQKIFISAGEHDLAENIVHLVLARIEGAPAGTKGISLFVCPKFIPDAEGRPGRRNALSCGKIEEKMGIHANATCVMDYDGATAWLVGEANKGLAAMFVMMNEARLAVGIQGLGIGEVAYQNAAAYARDRLQGRALTGPKAPDKPADPIIVHPDVRRTLMTIRALTEAGRALALATALQADLYRRAPDEKVRQAADDRLGLMTPVLKAMLTDYGFTHAVNAQQVLGGHGYIAEWGMEQFVRDARITMIYEGANGIQALDLVGRKLPRDGGRAMMAFLAEVNGFVRENEADARMGPYVAPLKASVGHLQQATMWFMQNAIARPDHAGAGSADYLHLLGLVALGHMWGLMARAALARSEEPAMQAKLVTGRFFAERLLPETGMRLARITAGADSVMALPAEMF
ncbi:acyl-CoA dehydrogenase C-terminal domain-containing protein [Labrys wisconsinensis]|uniref:Alkylation response protein AidB-like acyl-CoA dehydrogenase n=1 Tax=Labrys wisconsinensis TaxID=425677 RepID=A0ABU0JE06_9HYPH|nr:acyl-CoA dehydrogenase C-terminal domain-containing protein [Labrys wisconsinensis]MDQ0472511.1 alkylation response protein AidB-like acyl-CoA dehydrogenase [Labrys wisconsinensis]